MSNQNMRLKFEAAARDRAGGWEAYMVKKYALETQMKFAPPPKSTTSDGMTVEVTVASRDVRRLMRERTTMMAQNLGPF